MMLTCEFSEFSFGYALTDSLIHHFAQAVGAAPMFANQASEGKAGGGYDMKLPLNPIPIFFQFKIPQVLTKSSTLKPATCGVPYYRMHLRTKTPNQHKLLLDLEAGKQLVYYASPCFDKVVDLDSGFVTKQVHSRCLFIRPSRIGPLDSRRHHVSYQKGTSGFWIHSEPKFVEGEHDFERLMEDLRGVADDARRERGEQVSAVASDTFRGREVLLELRDWFVDNRPRDAILSREADDSLVRLLDREFANPEELVPVLGYVAQVRYGLTLALADADEIN